MDPPGKNSRTKTGSRSGTAERKATPRRASSTRGSNRGLLSGRAATLPAPPPYLDWLIPFLRALRTGKDESIVRGREALRSLIERGAFPSVVLQPIHQLVQITVDLTYPLHKRQHPGAYEKKLQSMLATSTQLEEVIRLRRDVARKSAELNQNIFMSRFPPDVLRSIRRNLGIGAIAAVPEALELLRRQPDHDRACADILEKYELPLWERVTAFQRMAQVTRKFLFYFLSCYLKARTGGANTERVVDLLTAAVFIAVVGPRAKEETGEVQPWRLPSPRASSRGKGQRRYDGLDRGYIDTLLSRFPTEFSDAAKWIEEWAKRESDKGAWRQSRDTELDQEITALMRSAASGMRG